MQEERANETTRLLYSHQPQYVFSSFLARKRRVKQFQCCLGAILLVAFSTALIVIISYAVNFPANADNSTLSNNQSDTVPSDSFIVLFNKEWPLDDHVRNISCNSTIDVKNAMLEGQNFLNQKDAVEKYSPGLEVDSPSYRHQKVMGTNEKSRNFSRTGYQMEGATRFVQGGNKNENKTLYMCLNNYSDNFTREMCTNITNRCNSFEKYRSYNGSCNNLKYFNSFGVAYRPFRRGIKPDYADNISKPRVSKGGLPLPSARTVSLEVHRPYYKDDSKFSVMLAVWGQFLDHDITATALSQKRNGSGISCCESRNFVSPECFPVIINQSDPFSRHNVTCMEFVRSAPSPTCFLGPREQMNQASAFIDGSVIYGNDKSQVLYLRSMSGGLLKMFLTEDNRTLLPVSEDMEDGCNRAEESSKGRYCFASGDSRANENVLLTSMHLIWARQHNFLAKHFGKLNPHWKDETIFQESRKIVAAQMQHITYKEFLPIILGKKLMRKHDLLPKSTGYFHKYNDSIDPSIANEFAAAAFRFAHTIIPGLVKLLANDTASPDFIQMRKMLFDPFNLYQSGHLDKTLKGAMNSNIEASDRYFSDELKSHLFERNTTGKLFPKQCGLDLVSLNIQRGRDHGIAGYLYWKEYCGLGRSEDFESLAVIMESSALENIEAIYRDVEDIDLYTGALSEKPLNGSIIGPTLTCLILDQFVRLKFGDRFWYENPQKPHGFSSEQLNEIRKTTLARVICDNADKLETIQPYVMERASGKNGVIPCVDIPSPDWGLWKENLTHVSVPTRRLHVSVINR